MERIVKNDTKVSGKELQWKKREVQETKPQKQKEQGATPSTAPPERPNLHPLASSRPQIHQKFSKKNCTEHEASDRSKVHIGIEPISPESESDVLTITPMNRFMGCVEAVNSHCVKTRVVAESAYLALWRVDDKVGLKGEVFPKVGPSPQWLEGREIYPWNAINVNNENRASVSSSCGLLLSTCVSF